MVEMQNFARELPAPTLREDAIYLGNEFRRTLMNLVFQVRFEFVTMIFFLKNDDLMLFSDLM